MNETLRGEIIKASVLGTMAFNNGEKCVPAFDKNLMEMLRDSLNTENVDNEHTRNVLLMKAWLKNWTLANSSVEA